MAQFQYSAVSKSGEKVNGCITNTAIQVTSEPNRIAIAVNKSNLTHDLMKASNKFNMFRK